MSIGGIQGRDLSAIRDQVQSFQQGKTNLQKSDLTELQSKLESAGQTLEAAGMGELAKSFDKIDQNGDGMSAQELQAFVKGKGGDSSSTPTAAPEASSQALPFQGVRGGGRPLSISIELEMSGPRRMPQGGGRSEGAQGISKEDLEALKQKFEQSGMEVPQGLEDLLSSFDETDGNSDGKLDLKELLEKLFQGKKSGSSGAALPTDESTGSAEAAGAANGTSVTLEVSSTSISIGRAGASQQNSSVAQADSSGSATSVETASAGVSTASTTTAEAGSTDQTGAAETEGSGSSVIQASTTTNGSTTTKTETNEAGATGTKGADATEGSSSEKRIDWRALFQQDRDVANAHPSSEGSRAPGVYQRYVSSYTQVSFAFSGGSFQTRA